LESCCVRESEDGSVIGDLHNCEETAYSHQSTSGSASIITNEVKGMRNRIH